MARFVEWREGKFNYVVEFGSRDINGTPRGLFGFMPKYHGIDLEPGPGVDEVADAREWRAKGEQLKPDCIVCCEVLEHEEHWRDIIISASKNLVRGGFFVVTCATNPREPHSASDGGPLKPGEYYGNVPLVAFEQAMRGSGFEPVHLEADRRRGDLYAIGEQVRI